MFHAGADLFHAGLGWPVLGAAMLLSFATSFLTAALGIGGGAIMLALLAFLLPPAALIPVHGLVQLGSNGGRAMLLRTHIRRASLWPFLGGAVLGVALGSVLLIDLPTDAILVAVGLFILHSVFLPPPAVLKRSAAMAGGLSSLLTMFVGATGPFVAAFVKTQGFDRHTHVATLAAMMTGQHLIKTIAFGLLGFAFAQWLGFVALLVLTGFGGTMAGRQVLARIDERRFRIGLNILLTLIAARLLWSGITGLMAPAG